MKKRFPLLLCICFLLVSCKNNYDIAIDKGVNMSSNTAYPTKDGSVSETETPAINSPALTESGEKPNDIVYDDMGYTELGEYLYLYFTKFYGILETGIIENVKEAENDVNTYILYKNMIYRHDLYRHLYKGIYNLSINRLEIENVNENGEHIEINVYVGVKYSFAEDNSGEGTLYSLRLMKNRIISIDDTTVESQMIKDELIIKKNALTSDNDAISTDLAFIDEIFEIKTKSIYND